MSRAVFVDTSAWYALANTSDTRHTLARHQLRRLLQQGRTLLTTNHVVSETYTLLRRRLGFTAAHQFLQHIRESASIQRTFIPEPWEQAAEGLLAQYKDQNFSYVDATSFVVMRRLGLHEAFAFDQDFLTAGFTLLSDDNQ